MRDRLHEHEAPRALDGGGRASPRAGDAEPRGALPRAGRRGVLGRGDLRARGEGAAAAPGGSRHRLRDGRHGCLIDFGGGLGVGWRVAQILEGPFSVESKPIFATIDSFCSIL